MDKQNTVLIFDIKKFAVHDGPGIRTTFFTMGCPLRCLWCQNPESFSPNQSLVLNRMKCIGCGACASVCDKIGPDLMLLKSECTLCGKCVSVCKSGARSFIARPYTPEMVVNEAMKDKIFYDQSGGGVTFSGGECMLHANFLKKTLKMFKDLGIHTTIDTCGYVPWENFEKVLPYTDLFLYDVKVMDPVRHKEYTGVDNSLILANLKKIIDLGASVIIRVPLIPGYTDNPDDMEALGNFIIGTLENKIIRVELLPYNKLAESKYENKTAYRDGGVGTYKLSDLSPQTEEYVESLKNILVKKDVTVFAEKL
ncbi:MAG TPA: glycyl-radical enzyme activating protein [Clostridiaceae bacterium]|nr:glycyl-radical enzyme activating protein [Clostridiaceae bacterium]